MVYYCYVLENFPYRVTSSSQKIPREQNLKRSSALTVNRKAIASLLCARLFYAVNYYNIATVFIFMAKELNSDIGGLGTITAAFLFGIGANQVPAGILASKYGSKKIIVIGTGIASITSLLTGFSSSVFQVTVLRFLTGFSMAFVFGPGVKLMAENFGKHTSLAVGLYNSFFWIGGAVGLGGWIFVAELTGWRNSLIMSGALGLVSSIILYFSLNDTERGFEFAFNWSQVRGLLFNRTVLIMGFASMGVNICSTVVTHFTAYYLESKKGISPELSSFVAMFTIISSAIAAIVSGRIFDKYGRLKPLFSFSIFGLFIGLLLESVGLVLSTVIATIIVGGFTGFLQTVIFSETRKLDNAKSRYEALAISWVNAIQFFGSFWSPIVFTIIVATAGYETAWFSICLFLIGLSLLVIFFDKSTKGEPYVR